MALGFWDQIGSTVVGSNGVKARYQQI